jgi:hypothetical protein
MLAELVQERVAHRNLLKYLQAWGINLEELCTPEL